MKKKLLIIFILALFIPFLTLNAEVVILDKCIDGDTASFIKNKDIIKARFLAIDTPEKFGKKEPFGMEASEFTCNYLTNASLIEIEYDKNSDKLDKYDRHLVWVFVDNELLQEKIIEQGFGKVAYLYGDYKYTKLLQQKEKLAKENNLNIWGDYVEPISLEMQIFNYLKENTFILILVIVLLFILLVSFPKTRDKFFKNLEKRLNKLLKEKQKL